MYRGLQSVKVESKEDLGVINAPFLHLVPADSKNSVSIQSAQFRLWPMMETLDSPFFLPKDELYAVISDSQ